MQLVIEVFLNGILGVFTGLAVLYGAIRLNQVLNGRAREEKDA